MPWTKDEQYVPHLPTFAAVKACLLNTLSLSGATCVALSWTGKIPEPFETDRFHEHVGYALESAGLVGLTVEVDRSTPAQPEYRAWLAYNVDDDGGFDVRMCRGEGRPSPEAAYESAIDVLVNAKSNPDAWPLPVAPTTTPARVEVVPAEHTPPSAERTDGSGLTMAQAKARREELDLTQPRRGAPGSKYQLPGMDPNRTGATKGRPFASQAALVRKGWG
ncbi:MAG: hypothetical protein IT477_10985 [Rhodanobacteraceae bacterium]|nr:hypothetical protein [Rhodanobacteraceae bacterium]